MNPYVPLTLDAAHAHLDVPNVSRDPRQRRVFTHGLTVQTCRELARQSRENAAALDRLADDAERGLLPIGQARQPFDITDLPDVPAEGATP